MDKATLVSPVHATSSAAPTFHSPVSVLPPPNSPLDNTLPKIGNDPQSSPLTIPDAHGPSPNPDLTVSNSETTPVTPNSEFALQAKSKNGCYSRLNANADTAVPVPIQSTHPAPDTLRPLPATPPTPANGFQKVQHTAMSCRLIRVTQGNGASASTHPIEAVLQAVSVARLPHERLLSLGRKPKGPSLP